MGIDQAMVATGTTFDVALERLRERRAPRRGGGPLAGAARGYEAHKAHVRRMVGLLRRGARAGAGHRRSGGREIGSRRDESADLERRRRRRRSGRAFDRRPLRRPRVPREPRRASSRWTAASPSSATSGPTRRRSSGRSRSPRSPRASGSRRAQRGILVGKQYAEEWLKLKNARRLDQIKDLRDRRGKRIADDEELQRWVRDNRRGVREILLQLDPVDARTRSPRGCGAGARRRRARRRRRRLAARRCSRAAVRRRPTRTSTRSTGSSTTSSRRGCASTRSTSATRSPSRRPSKSGYFSSVNVKVYGFLQFKGIERSGIAGMM